MSGNVCVSVRGVSKKFARSLRRSFVYGARDIGSATLGRADDATLRESEFWAVRNVSFDLHHGRSIGVIGLNGNGKTTLMRMVSGKHLPEPLAARRAAGRHPRPLRLGRAFAELWEAMAC